MARAVWLMNSLLYCKSENNSPRICRKFSKKVFFTKFAWYHFPRVSLPFSNFSKFVRKLTDNYSKRKSETKVFKNIFLCFYRSPDSSENFETILVNIRFQFCSTAESIGQDGAILPDDQPVRLRESLAG